MGRLLGDLVYTGVSGVFFSEVVDIDFMLWLKWLVEAAWQNGYKNLPSRGNSTFKDPGQERSWHVLDTEGRLVA